MVVTKPICFQLLPVIVSVMLWRPEQASAIDAFDHPHARYAELLSKFVRDGRVDYTGLRTAPTELDAYLNELAAVKPDEFAAWNRENRLALLLNLYNARTLRLIIDHYARISPAAGSAVGPGHAEDDVRRM